MDKKQTDILISEKINEDIINDKSNNSNELSNIIIIKELINSLKEKINIYEKQIKKLIDDKVKLQMDMNSIILQNLSLKKKNNSLQNIENSKEDNILNFNPLNNEIVNNKNNNQDNSALSTLIDINKKLLEQNKELRSQIDIFKSNIEVYKQKSINIKEKLNEKDKKCQFCEEKKLELNKMASEKEEIFNSIKSLRKQLDELKLNEKIKKEKKSKQKIGKNESLPNIEQYFIVNNKFQLVDSNKNLWHMKKCMKFQEFKKKFEKSSISPDDLLKEYVETYEVKLDEDNNEENEFYEGFNSSESGNENERKKHENKYMPPLPGMSNSTNKKKISNNQKNDIINNDDSEIINNNNNNIKSDDIQINIDEKEENKNDKENKEIEQEEKKMENNENNVNNINTNNMNEIKEETSFNLSDNTD